jgi:hypothetical protein
MPMEAAAEALGTTVRALRLRIVHGTLKSRMTPAGIPQVLVGRESAVAVMGRAGQPTLRVNPRPPSIFQAITARFRWVGHRQGFTWVALYLALALLLALQARPKHSQAADSFPAGKSGSAFPGESEDYTQGQRRTRFRQSTTQPTTQEVSSIAEFRIDKRFRRQGTIHRELITPIVGAADDQTSEVVDSIPFAPPISFWESVSGFSRNIPRHGQTASRNDEGAMNISAVSVGSYPGDLNVMLWDSLNIQIGQPLAIPGPGSPLGATTNKTIAAAASAFHLDPPLLGSFPIINSGDPGSPTVGGSPPPLEGSISASPEPSSAVLLGLGSTALLLHRRRVR